MNDHSNFANVLSECICVSIKLLKDKGIVNNMEFSEPFSANAINLGSEIASLIEKFINELLQVQEEQFFTEDEMVIDELEDSQIHHLSQSLSQTDIDTDSSQQSNYCSSDYEPCKKKEKLQVVSLEKKISILKLHREHPNWTFATLKCHAGKALTRMDELHRWKKDILKGGTKFDKSLAIKNWTYDRFCEARKEKIPITTRNLQEWSLQAAQQFQNDNFTFTASVSWVERFKKEFKIKQRKVTRYIKPTEFRSFEDVLKAAEAFQAECQIISSTADLNYLLNTDQMGCEYRANVDRTLEHSGKKTVEVHLGDINKVTHTYTVQYSITASGRLLPKVFICLQELSGKFGPRIQQHIEELEKKYKNISVHASKSGKCSTILFSNYVIEILKPYVQDNSFTLILDSWGGQGKPELYECFQTASGASTCNLKYIPPACTMYCQPLDLYMHRQIKLFIKKLQNCMHLLENQRQLNTRDDAIQIHALIHQQLSAPVFHPMIQYSWYAAKLIHERDIFLRGCRSYSLHQKPLDHAASNGAVVRCRFLR